MATYSYQCSCGLQFEAIRPMSMAKEPRECPACGTKAPRKMPTEVAGVFDQAVTGPVPQNTGVSKLDADIDRVIGQSAKQGWNVAGRRVEEKKKVLQETGADGHNLSRNVDGSYRVLQPEEKGVQDRALAIHSKAMETLRPKKKANG